MTTITELQQALIDTNLIDPDAIDDPEGYDAGSTVAQIDELHKLLFQTQTPKEPVSWLNQPRPGVFNWQRGCRVCGTDAAPNTAMGYVCPRMDCPARVTCGVAA